MFELSFLQISSRAIAIVVVLSILGFAVAAFGRLLGDRGVAHDAKITLNPFVHVDIFALIAGIAGRVGWVRPIAIDPTKCRGGRAGPVLVAIAAMIAVFVFGQLVILVLPWVATSWPSSSAAFVDATIRDIADAAAWTLVVNVIPVPPLLGGYLLQAVAPNAHGWLVKRHFWVSIGLLVLVIVTYSTLPSTVLGDWAAALGAR